MAAGVMSRRARRMVLLVVVGVAVMAYRLRALSSLTAPDHVTLVRLDPTAVRR